MFRSAYTLLLVTTGVLTPAVRAATGPQDVLTCENGMKSAATLNSMQLFGAAGSCFNEGNPIESGFLMIAGQIRSTADMGLLRPSGEQDKQKAAELYGFIFYRAGGAGDEEIYRDPARTDRLLGLISSWRPELPEDYDPGWAYRRRPVEARYFESLEHSRAVRILQLRHYASLLRDEAYYAAHAEEQDLRRRNPNGYVVGTADHERKEQLQAIMNEAAARIPEPKYPKPPAYEYTPEPDAGFRLIYTGFNGPAATDTVVAASAKEARRTWLIAATGERKFAELTDQVDFEHELLVVHSIGKRMNATGRIHVVDVDAGRANGPVSVSVTIGVNEEECEWPDHESYPFVVVAARRGMEDSTSSGYYHGNFGDGCKQPASGKPTAVVSQDTP